MSNLSQQARALWQIIRNETVRKANTAERTGAAGEAIIDAVESLETQKLNASDFSVANNLTTTTAGKVLDARQGKVLKDLIPSLDSIYNWLKGTMYSFSDGQTCTMDFGKIVLMYVDIYNQATKEVITSQMFMGLGDNRFGLQKLVLSAIYQVSNSYEIIYASLDMQGNNTVSLKPLTGVITNNTFLLRFLPIK
ncbi:MAG: hypothetical protein LBS50_01425 [Prevotellaceae bacterium]|jgi:hypothetical protein|nr:hypothetical protein [Prevotellaceae bacterium]